MNVRNFDLVKGMQIKTKSISVLLLATITMATAAVFPATTYNDTVKPNFSHPIPNVPGKSLVAVEVSYPAGGASAPHRHSAFVYGAVRKVFEGEMDLRHCSMVTKIAKK